MTHLQGQSVLVLGLGTSGLAMARWCARQGAQVSVLDNRDQVANDAVLAAQHPQVTRLRGGFSAEVVNAQALDRIFASPGLSPTDLAPLRQAAQAKGIALEGELALFQEALNALAESRNYQPKVLAITGTNGKTTVTSLTTQLLLRAGVNATMAGNIGPSLLDTLGDALDNDQLPDVWVLELSSFQLDGYRGFTPHCATVLNITQDHLDWHGSMAAYQAAKLNIFGPTTGRIFNRDDPALVALATPAVTALGKTQMTSKPGVVTIGTDLPTKAHDLGIETVNGMAWLVQAQWLDPTAATRRNKNDQDKSLVMQRLMPVEALRIRGRHNALNALAALALAQSVGAPLAPMLYGLREYKGEPHRVEPVAIVDDVEYFDDSKGTNVGATVAAIDGLGVDRQLVLILGGDGKGQDFSPLVTPLRHHARAIVLIGKDANQLAQVLAGLPVPVQHAQSLPQAVVMASTLAQPGDAVVLSPACASLDMFNNYQHRAQVFCEAVEQLALNTSSGGDHA